MSAIGDRLRELRQESGKNQTEFATVAGVSRNAQVNYESGKRSPDADYMAALQAAGFDIQYVLTGFRASEVPGAREFMDRMEDAASKMRALWRAYQLPEDADLFAAMQGVRAIPGATDGHTAHLARAFTALLQHADNTASHATTPATPTPRALAQPMQAMDEALLRDCVAGVEEYLGRERRTMEVDIKAALIVEVYMYFREQEQTKVTRGNVLEFIRRAA